MLMTIDFRAEENTRLKHEIERLSSPKRYMSVGKLFP
ncbi:MAG: cell division protein FtsL [Cycloclasticus sp.]